MASHFSKDAEMRFEGIPVGPFRGRAAIEEAYGKQPPDDEIVVLNTRQGPDRNVIVGEYSWSKNPKVRAGELKIVARGEEIVSLTIRYER